MPRLVYQDAKNQLRSFALRKKIVTIGRSKENDLVLDHPSILEGHAHILRESSGYVLRTVEPGARVSVNGRLGRTHTLRPDDRIALGGISLTFLMDDEPSSSKERELTPPSALFSRLLSFSEKLMQDLSPEELFRSLLDQLIEVTGADKGFLILVRDQRLEIPVARNLERTDLERSLEQVSDSIVHRVLDSREPILVANALRDERFSQAQSVVDMKLSSVMCVPLQFKNQLLGALYLGNDRVAGMFRKEDLETLRIYAGQASLILHSAQILNELQVDNKTLRDELKNAALGRIIGQSPPMRAISATIDKIADVDISLMICGETGTGKELIAREVHARGNRRDKPFISINCGAIPDNLLESELFGHVKGAFTGAVSHRIGKFEVAHGGTIFLDEIGEMPMALQVKLLRVLQERVVDKIGESRPIPVDIRVISATNRDLEQAIADGEFREDLYYRLNELTIVCPPLRERGEDVILLARYLLDKYVSRYPSSKVKGFTKEALTAMRRYAWPGNVRQLENRIKRAVIMAESPMLTPADLDIKLDAKETKIQPLAKAQAEFTLNYIKQVLEINNWNKTQTARDLEVDPRTIFRYLEKLNDGG